MYAGAGDAIGSQLKKRGQWQQSFACSGGSVGAVIGGIEAWHVADGFSTGIASAELIEV
jgi:hypothetical protein